jgi:hypothetical protein
MAYRIFTDSNGTEWQSWDVLPKGAERRLADRRHSTERVNFADRRKAERRQLQGRWTLLTSGLKDGWLCFESSAERRRLTPIPTDWEDCPLPALEGYCRSAIPVRVSSLASRRAG